MEIATSPDWETLLRDFSPSLFGDRSNRNPNTPSRTRDAHNDTFSGKWNDIWRPPDPGFHQEKYTESDLDDEWVFDLSTTMREPITDFYATYGQKISVT